MKRKLVEVEEVMKLCKELDTQLTALSAEFDKARKTYEDRIVQLTKDAMEAQRERDSYKHQWCEASEEAAALKVLYLPYIQNDVENCQ
jgi:hypothetical protein